MTLGVILAIGESLTDLEEKGQAARMVDYNIKNYAQSFDEVFLFSYANETWSLPKNCHLVPNRFNIPRIIYSFAMPFINWRQFVKCDAIRAFQITGGLTASIIKIFFGKKFIVNYGYDYQKVAYLEGKFIRSILLIPLTILVALFADSIIVTNKILIRNLPKLSRSHISIIPNGIDVRLFKPRQKKINKSDIALLFVGRLEKEKNLNSLLRAISGLKNVTLTVIGQGSQESLLKNLVQKLKLSVRFISKVNYYSLPRYYNEADVFILPSFTEGHSKVLLEAQSTGLICIASDIPANREIITSDINGLLCKTTVSGIKRVIEKVISDRDLRAKMKRHAREKALKDFAISKLVEKEIRLIRSLA